MAPAELIRSDPLIEQILDAHSDRAGGNTAGYGDYRGHVYRVFNYSRALAPDSGDRDEKLAIAAVFHDIDAFSGLDYLAESIRIQDAWLAGTGRARWSEELAVVVAEHHRLTPYRGRHATLAEPFRRADLIDVSQGLLRAGLPREFVASVRRTFDVGSFFTRAIPLLVVHNLREHPLDPMPHLRARRALTQAAHAGADR